MDSRRWFNSGQPQTLQVAQIFLYFNGAFLLLQGMFAGGLNRLAVVIAVGQVVAAFGIANEKKWGYWLGVAFALLPFAFIALVAWRYHVLAVGLFSLVFDVALVVVLLHPMTRDYKRIWFR